MNKTQKAGFVTGVFSFIFILFFADLDPARPQITQMAAVVVLMSAWWVTEAVPLAATSLIPLILFPLMGMMNGEKVAGSYINSIIFLFLGGFLLAVAMERWGLHKRVALKIITLFGGSPRAVILGLMFATGFISMWISNTATVVMMFPIGLAIIHKMEADFGREKTHNFSIALLLAIAYAGSIGGIGTLIGTPPNLIFVRISHIIFPEAPEISFGRWMMLAVPIAAIMLLATGFFLTKVYYKIDYEIEIDKKFIKDEYLKLGAVSFEEKVISIVFSAAAFLWIFRQDLDLGFITIPGWDQIFYQPKYLNDGVVAVTMAMILFIIPAKNTAPGEESGKTTILGTHSFMKIPWGIILLFGGGFALAEGFIDTGLAEYIGSHFKGLHYMSPLLMLLIVGITNNFLTEFTSNTASAQMILPVMASVAVALGIHPWLLMITATLAVSLGFMMPAGTAPNTIVFASERLKIMDMVKAGFILNLIGVIIITLLVYFLGTFLFNLDIFPGWAITK
ncbi:MAG: SLC13 family permease [Ignavibacteriaceae bacterium]